MPRLFGVPLPWRTKKFKTISVDYKFGQMCGTSKMLKTINIKDAVENARLWLTAADTEVQKDPSAWSTAFKNAFQVYFGFAPTDPGHGAHIEEVRRVINATMLGAQNPLHIASICRWRGGETSTQGYVKTHKKGNKGRIHVALPQFKSTEEADRVEQCCIIVHEATHKFADTSDDSYLGKSDFPPAAVVNALTCADCYTYFIRDALASKLDVDSWKFFRNK